MEKDLLTIKELNYNSIYINTISLLDIAEVIGLLELEYKGKKTILYAKDEWLGICDIKDVLNDADADKIKKRQEINRKIKDLEKQLKALS